MPSLWCSLSAETRTSTAATWLVDSVTQIGTAWNRAMRKSERPLTGRVEFFPIEMENSELQSPNACAGRQAGWLASRERVADLKFLTSCQGSEMAAACAWL